MILGSNKFLRTAGNLNLMRPFSEENSFRSEAYLEHGQLSMMEILF